MRPTLLNFEQCVTAEHVAENVWRAAKCAYDPILAAAMEALVYRQVLEAIAEGRTVDPEGIAAEALKAGDVESIITPVEVSTGWGFTLSRGAMTPDELAKAIVAMDEANAPQDSLGVVVNDPNGRTEK